MPNTGVGEAGCRNLGLRNFHLCLEADGINEVLRGESAWLGRGYRMLQKRA